MSTGHTGRSELLLGICVSLVRELVQQPLQFIAGLAKETSVRPDREVGCCCAGIEASCGSSAKQENLNVRKGLPQIVAIFSCLCFIVTCDVVTGTLQLNEHMS